MACASRWKGLSEKELARHDPRFCTACNQFEFPEFYKPTRQGILKKYMAKHQACKPLAYTAASGEEQVVIPGGDPFELTAEGKDVVSEGIIESLDPLTEQKHGFRISDVVKTVTGQRVRFELEQKERDRAHLDPERAFKKERSRNQAGNVDLNMRAEGSRNAQRNMPLGAGHRRRPS